MATSNSTALAGQDFVSTTGTLNFAAEFPNPDGFLLRVK